ncbi:hypothetical protein SETIT_5G257800v2 [Setaria italica]|uniref:Uncharacterized protein n=1 Tax=Setaria italica TaxID=4555 RepID=A0A368R934_SETIT|nr:hypothetical protein SETIT_5G257800v2 [Setaria italica]
MERSPGVPEEHFTSLVLLCCWQLWKRRNEVVFRGERWMLRQTLKNYKDDAQLWRCRLPRCLADVASKWCQLFSGAM